MTENINTSDQQPVRFTAEDLVGAWECFEGDGIHGWEFRVLVFHTDGGRMMMEYWLPTRKGDRIGKLSRSKAVGVNCLPSGTGLRLLLDQNSGLVRSLEIVPTRNGTFRLTIPQATAGATYYRRTSMPTREAPLD